MKKYRVGVIGATGMVGQRFLTLLESHPMFEVGCLAASAASAGRRYGDAVKRWNMPEPVPERFRDMTVMDAEKDMGSIASESDFCFCAVNMPRDDVKRLEEGYARLECPVVSNNSANRDVRDVPMVIPEINADHLDVIPQQRARLHTRRGFIAVKSNCSLQSYVPLLHPLMRFGPEKVAVTTYQAISGAGRVFETMPEIADNVIPYIPGEEEKSETEPMKIWGRVTPDGIENATSPTITAQCLRVPVSDGHTAAVFVKFRDRPTRDDILDAWESYAGEPQRLSLPSAPERFIRYFDEDDRPQPALDRMCGNGMTICAGRLREDSVFDYRFVGMSHNTLRGAAGGAVLLAELLAAKGYFE